MRSASRRARPNSRRTRRDAPLARDVGILPAARAGQGDGRRRGCRASGVSARGERSSRLPAARVNAPSASQVRASTAARPSSATEPETEGEAVEAPVRRRGAARCASPAGPCRRRRRPRRTVPSRAPVRSFRAASIRSARSGRPMALAGRRRQGGGEVGMLQRAAEPSVEEGAAGELRDRGLGEVLQVDLEPGRRRGARWPGRRGGRRYAAPSKRGALEGVAVIDLREPPAEGVGCGRARGRGRAAPSGQGALVRRSTSALTALRAGSPLKTALAVEAAGEGPAGEVREGREVGERRVDGAGEGVLADAAGIGRLERSARRRRASSRRGWCRAAACRGSDSAAREPMARRRAGSARRRPSTRASAVSAKRLRIGAGRERRDVQAGLDPLQRVPLRCASRRP